MNPSDALMEVLANQDVDDMANVIIIYRRKSGNVGYLTDSTTDLTDVLGIIQLLRILVEERLKKSWTSR